MGARFWEGVQLVDLNMLQYDGDVPVDNRQFSMIAQFHSVVSKSPEIVSGGGNGVDVIKTLVRSPSSDVGLHYPFDVKSLIFEKLLWKPSYIVMGCNDFFVL